MLLSFRQHRTLFFAATLTSLLTGRTASAGVPEVFQTISDADIADINFNCSYAVYLWNDKKAQQLGSLKFVFDIAQNNWDVAYIKFNNKITKHAMGIMNDDNFLVRFGTSSSIEFQKVGQAPDNTATAETPIREVYSVTAKIDGQTNRFKVVGMITCD